MTHITGHSHLHSALLVAIGFVVLACSATELRATVILPNVPAGTQYEILFVTLDTTAATSTDISTYNAFATSEAKLSPALAALTASQNVTWQAVGTTAGISALLNAPDNDIAVYNTQGIELATAATGIYNGSLLSPVQFDQFGSSEPATVWTGTQPDGGNALGLYQLGYGGGGQVLYGDSSLATGRWIDVAGADFSTLPIYALSSPITSPTVPEPATIALLVSTLVVIGGMRLVRRRKLA